VTDDDAAQGSGVIHVTATNVEPQAAITGGDRASIEGQAVNFQGTWSDPGLNDTHTYNWKVAATNGQIIADGTVQNFAFTPANNGVYSITYTVTDNFGDATSARVTLNVANAAPTVSAFNGPTTTPAGAVAHFLGAFSDVQADFTGMRGNIAFADGVTLPLALNPDGSFSIDRIFTNPGPQAATLSLTDPDGAVTTRTVNLTVTTSAPPRVTAAAILRDLTPLTIKLNFNTDISASLAAAGGAAALTLRNLTTVQTVSPTAYTYTWDAATNSALFRFINPPAKGNYTATLSAAQITTPAGLHLDGNGDGTAGDDYVLSFFHLPGDFNLDRSVGFADLIAVAQHYNTAVTQYAQGDVNGDGQVGFADLVAVAQNYNTTLPFPGPVAAPAEVPIPVAATPTPSAVPTTPTVDAAIPKPQPTSNTSVKVLPTVSPVTKPISPQQVKPLIAPSKPATCPQTKPVAKQRAITPKPVSSVTSTTSVSASITPPRATIFAARRINQNDLLK